MVKILKKLDFFYSIFFLVAIVASTMSQAIPFIDRLSRPVRKLLIARAIGNPNTTARRMPATHSTLSHLVHTCIRYKLVDCYKELVASCTRDEFQPVRIMRSRTPYTVDSFWALDCVDPLAVAQLIVDTSQGSRVAAYNSLFGSPEDAAKCSRDERSRANLHIAVLFSNGRKLHRSGLSYFSGWDALPHPDDLLLLQQIIKAEADLYTIDWTQTFEHVPPQCCTPLQWSLLEQFATTTKRGRSITIHCVQTHLLAILSYVETHSVAPSIFFSIIEIQYLRFFLSEWSAIDHNHDTRELAAADFFATALGAMKNDLFFAYMWVKQEPYLTCPAFKSNDPLGIKHDNRIYALFQKEYARRIQSSDLHAILSEEFDTPLRESVFFSTEISEFLCGKPALPPRLTESQQIEQDRLDASAAVRNLLKRKCNDFPEEDESVKKPHL